MGERLERFGLAALRAVSRLPYPVLRRLGEAVGSLAWWLAAPRRRIALTNLRLCFPDWTDAKRRQVARDHFRYYVRSFLERFVFWYGSPERIRALCQVEGIEHLEAHHGKPMILLAPHFLGLDAGGTRLQADRPVASMYAAQKSRVLTEAMTRGRSRFHPEASTMILRTEGLRAALKPIRDGIPFYFLPDMDLGPRDAVFVPFFGVPAATVTSMARLAKITKAVIVPCITRMTDEGYVVRVYPAWEDYPVGDAEADALRMNAFIEARVLEMPAQYLWTHKRFKTRPPGAPDLYGRRTGEGD
ncbi:LpxL/LpxP family acyltransferase [Zeimonas arvi]|uniref:Lipid A biosynthesis acyltransferase n=1 Tax=Zeimonas arvi TaxID=2498847 RepID=A0A5C8NW94_9BURK|nr:lipid A biosynthesis acyltransferase [Zeimonas arvi]TXL65369.1 lipid A biosynthesis acyltransferase [Zeimonas arvi]